MPVTVVLGRTSLDAEEASSLKTGSIIPLENDAEEPVEVLIGDRLAGKGEVVVIDGNFGPKLTELIE